MDEQPLKNRGLRNLPASIAWFAAVLVVVGASGLIVMARTSALGEQRTRLAGEASRGPRVLVEHVQAEKGQRRLSFPATVVGYAQTPVFAKVPGYLKEIRVDKGDRVRQGQVLAILTSPEVDEQTADARHNLWLQRITNRRNLGLLRTHAVSQQVATLAAVALHAFADTAHRAEHVDVLVGLAEKQVVSLLQALEAGFL